MQAVAEARQERLFILLRVGRVGGVIGGGNIHIRTVSELFFKPLHKFLHSLDFAHIAQRQAERVVEFADAVIENIIKESRCVKSAVRPRGLLAGHKVFDTAYHPNASPSKIIAE